MVDTMPGVLILGLLLSLGTTEMIVVTNVEGVCMPSGGRLPLRVVLPASDELSSSALVSCADVVDVCAMLAICVVLVARDVGPGAGTGGSIVLGDIGVITILGCNTDGGSGL